MKNVLMLIVLTFGMIMFQGSFSTIEAQSVRTVVKIQPQARVAHKPRRPSRNHIWIPNEWRWNGRTYVLVAGHWAKPRRGMIWKSGRWKRVNGGYIWIAGRWIRR